MSGNYGWAGKILRVDLTSGETWTDDTAKYVPKFIGGIGLGWKIMWEEVGPDIRAFDPENRLIFAIGPATGSDTPTSGRTETISKSPHTYPVEMVTRSGFGGGFGAELKFAGYDAIVIHGKAKNPVYLSIRNDKAELKDATHLWGKDTFTAQNQMAREMGGEGQTLAIGLAGENLSRLGAIISDTGHGSGQGGFGAVMGSKNLKGVVVRGTNQFRSAASTEEMGELVHYAKTLISVVQTVVPSYKGNVRSTWRARPGLYWEGGDEKVYIGEVDPKDIDRMGLRTMISELFGEAKCAPYHVKNVGCYSCPLTCYSLLRVPAMKRYGLPEEGRAICSQYGYNPKNATGETVFLGKQLLDTLGLNAFEMWTIIRMLRWMNRNGLIDERESGLPFSDEEEGDGSRFITTLCQKMAHREGIGDLLAEGAARAAEKLGLWEQMWSGKPGPEIAYFAHGMHDHYNPRFFSIISGLNYIMDNRDPNRHEHNGLLYWSGLPFEQVQKIAKKHFGSEKAIDQHGLLTPYDPAKGKFAIFVDHRGVLKDSITLCDWVFPNMVCPHPERDYLGDTSLESKFFSAVTGIKTSEEELDKMAERAWNLHRAQTIRDWGTKDMRNKHDLMAEWNFIYPEDKEPFTAGGRLDRADVEAAKEDYYRQRGWDVKTGAPTRAKLEELDLKEVADELEKRNLL